MADNVTVEVTDKLPDSPPESWREVFKGWLEDLTKKRPVAKADAKALADAAKVLQAGGYDISAAKLAQMMTEPEEEDVEEEDEDMPMPPVPAKKSALPDEAITTIVKAQIEAVKSEYAGVLEEVKKANQFLATENQKLRTDLDGLRSDRDSEKTARRKVEALKKAESLRMLPGATSDLAELLIKAEDALGEDYGKLETLLKTADRQLFASNLFTEMGTARTPEQITLEDKVSKAAGGETSYEQALLNLSADEQRELLKSWDKAKGGN